MKPHYCYECGNVLETRKVDHREREVCPVCGWVHYLQLKVGAAVIIERDDKLLLLQRSYEPWVGSWMLPAGYVEADEAPRDAAVREVHEETGLHVDDLEFVDAYFFSDDPRGNGISFVFNARKISGELNINHESASAVFFGWQEIPSYLTKGAHDLVIAGWQKRKKDRS